MIKSLYDIAIIGGGLAGLSLAIQSAEKGYKVILFEKENYPFHKVCGEYISLESRPFLERLGVPFMHLDLPVINKLSTSDVEGHLYNFNLPLGGFGISRYQLDNILYKMAVDKGVHVLTQTKVSNVSFTNDKFQITSSAGNFVSAVVAGCYGKRSNIDVKLQRPFLKQKSNKLNGYIGIKYHIKYNHAGDTIALHNFHNGYCGISKIEEDKSCLCYLTTEANLQKNGNSIAEMEKHILLKNPVLKRIFTEAEFLYDKPLAISKVSFNKKQQVEDHIIMIGDAAGMITPLCGNGMSMAMHASRLAFEAVDLFLKKAKSRFQMEEMYKQSWNKQFSKRLLTGRMVQRVMGGNTSTALFLKTMSSIPAVAQLIIKSTHGEVF